MRSKDPDLMEKILETINDYYFKMHYMPSVNDIAKTFGISKSTAHRYLIDMDGRGMLSYKSGSLSTEMVDKLSFDVVNAPLIGYVACGEPFPDEQQAEEFIPLPVAIFGSGDKFILQASGDSMEGAGISSGDLVVMRRQRNAGPGHIVAALVDHHEVTLKRLLYNKDLDCLYLHPENPRYEDMYFSDIEVQGVLDSIIKRGPF